jgi:D-alanyl-lipoteichoic acid acyltransferase DltB (MBOAT superfamily)
MLFSSLEYFIFLPLVVVIYWLLPHRIRWAFLLLSSIIFLVSARVSYLFVVLAVIIINYISGFFLDPESKYKHRKLVFILTLVADLGILVFYKYFNFLNDNLSQILNLFGFHNPIPALSILLPLGISFYTFQAIGYSYDIYMGNQKPEKNPGLVATYILFFPKLIAGPVERSYKFIPQLYKSLDFDYNRTVPGLRLILWGLFKKIVIGDRLTIFVNHGFNNIQILPLEVQRFWALI